MTGSDVIRDVARDLNDYGPDDFHVRWPVEQLQSYLHEALINVSTSLRDLFTDTLVVRIQPGSNWQTACDCTKILRVLGESTASGNVIRYLSRIEDDEDNTWAGPVVRCSVSPKDYAMTGYMLSSTDETEFKVFPPVPPGVTKYVLVQCYTIPDGSSSSVSIPDEALAMVKQWMLYRALSMDSELNPTIVELANQHRQTYFSLLDIALTQREMEKRDGSVRTVQNSSSD